MAHLRIHLSTEAFNRLRGIAGRTGRSVVVEGSLVLEAALLGVELDSDVPPTSVGIHRRAEARAAAAARGETT